MGKIIGDPDKEDQTEHPDDECGYGYSYGASHGDRDGTPGRYRYYT